MDINIQKKMEEKTIEMTPVLGKKKTSEKKSTSMTDKPVSQKPKENPVDMEEQYKGLVNQLYERNQQLVEALSEKNTALMFKRMDYLFKIIENSHMFDDEFVAKCIDELQKTLDVTQVETNTEDGEQD